MNKLFCCVIGERGALRTEVLFVINGKWMIKEKREKRKERVGR